MRLGGWSLSLRISIVLECLDTTCHKYLGRHVLSIVSLRDSRSIVAKGIKLMGTINSELESITMRMSKHFEFFTETARSSSLWEVSVNVIASVRKARPKIAVLFRVMSVSTTTKSAM